MIKILANNKYFEIIINALNYLFTRHNNAVDESKQIIWQITDKINLSSNTTYILFNPFKINPMPKNYIIYNFEQFNITLDNDIQNFDNTYWDKLQNAKYVWDYSLINIEYLKVNHNINAIFFPMGWTPTMKQFNPIKWSERINTMMFIGLMNEKRRNFLKPIHTYFKEENLNMYLSNKCWDDEYKHISSISKIALNIHYYSGNTILEIHRIIPLILHDIWVCSERSQDTFYDELFDGIVDWIDKDTCTSRIKEILNYSIDLVEQELKERKRKLIIRCDYWKIFNENQIIAYI